MTRVFVARTLCSRLTPALLFLAVGCGDSQIKTYRVAKEDNTPKLAAAAPDEDPHEAAHPAPARSPVALPKLGWELPKGWKELPPDGMRKALFEVPGPEGRIAQVMVIPLPGASNIEPESVNMWREELGLKPLERDEVKAQAQPVDFGDAKGDLFEIVSVEPKAGQTGKTRTLGAMAERDQVMWFAKMTGEDALVAQQKPAFISFIKSLSFQKPEPAQLAAAERPASTNSKKVPDGSTAPKWNAPANWHEKAPGPMITAAYTISGAEGQAEVSISKFPGDVGGLVANVNRWRAQLGLPPQGDAETRQSTEMVEIDGKKDAYKVDLEGTNARSGKHARMVAIAVPRGGETWFYKLLGDGSVVEKEKDAFLKFVLGAY